MGNDGGGERRDLLKAATEMTGMAAGAATGVFLGGPEGAAAGAALSVPAAASLRWAAREVGDRIRGRRGQQRAMGAVVYAAQRLELLRAEGAQVRSDGFFDGSDRWLSGAQEIAEGVLLAAEGSFEERKVAHIGYLFANVAIDEGIDRALAGMALQRANALTWRQFQLLALVGARDEVELPQVDVGDDPGSWEPWGAHRELMDLFTDGYVDAGQEHTARGVAYPSRSLASARLTPLGILLHGLLSLDLIPRTEVDGLAALLATRRPESGDVASADG